MPVQEIEGGPITSRQKCILRAIAVATKKILDVGDNADPLEACRFAECGIFHEKSQNGSQTDP
jgi:hypothetical protein